MIRRKTLLVLGAGASHPYGLPLGSELTDNLCLWAFQPPNEQSQVAQLVAACGNTLQELIQFCRGFHRSLLPSVDTYLAHCPHLARIGKLLIAYTIGIQEKDEDRHWFVSKDHWYRHLWNMMREECEDAERIPNNQLRIITFNYDRSLEYALYRAVRYTFGAADVVAQRILERLSIRHVYGQLAPFHFLGREGNGRFYRPISDAQELEMASNGIHTIPEARANAGLFDELRDWFYWADNVVFMGFSFDKINVERLGFPNVVALRIQRFGNVGGVTIPRVFACTYKMKEAEVIAARLRTCGADLQWTPIDASNLDFLRSIPFDLG
jgi:hypothetical protein